jgi:hypothetical protein
MPKEPDLAEPTQVIRSNTAIGRFIAVAIRERDAIMRAAATDVDCPETQIELAFNAAKDEAVEAGTSSFLTPKLEAALRVHETLLLESAEGFPSLADHGQLFRELVLYSQ